MERAILIAIALFALAAWRVVFVVLQQRQRPLPSATPPPRQSKDKRHRPQWLLPCVELTTGSGLGSGFVRAESRADMYLRRVVAQVPGKIGTTISWMSARFDSRYGTDSSSECETMAIPKARKP